MSGNTISKEERNARNIAEREHFEKNVVTIFNSFFACFAVLTAVLAALGIWLMHYVHI